ncbi:MAG TPA: hypothetical protein VNN76_03785 [Bacteroidota bacterium]|nr:hypothetical protein [Bacteroidota bacterium]
MQKFVQSGNLFFATALMFAIVALLTGRIAVYLSVAVVFFILGLAAKKKSAQKASADPPRK